MPRVTFVGKRALVRVHGNSTTPQHALLKFGSVFEVDRFGRKVLVHAVPDLSNLTPTMTYGTRTAGQASYTWIKLRYGMTQLGLNTSPGTCAAAAQASIAQEQMARAQAAAAAQRAQVDAMAASGAVSGAAGSVPGAAALGTGAGAGYGALLPGAQLPPGYSALQQGGMPVAATPAAPSNPFLLPQSPVYAAVSNNLGRRLKQMYAYAPQQRRPTFANWAPAAPSLPAGYGAAAGQMLAAPSYGAAAGAAGPAYDPTAEGYLTLTFFTGFANATSFPYGKGNSVSVPGKGLKWSLEASNWPFCSFDHSLAFELGVSTTKPGTAMGQWMVGSEDLTPADKAHAQEAAGRGPAMVNDAFTAPHATRRSLKQAGLGAFLNYMEEEETPASRAAKRAKLGPGYGMTRVAKLLLNDTAAVELSFPTYAFESAIGSRAVNVSILLDSQLAASPPGKPSAPAVFTFGVPYFQSLFYDPTVSFGDNTGMPISDLAQLPAGCSDATCGAAAVAAGKVVRRGDKGAKSGAGVVAAASGGGLVAAVLTALLMVAAA
jgi:hypothetical protein